MSEIIARIRQIIEYKGISERSFCLEVGIANGFMSKVSDVGYTKLKKILYAYDDISPLWLMTGEGDMLTSQRFDVDKSVAPKRDESKNNTPYIYSSDIDATKLPFIPFGDIKKDQNLRGYRADSYYSLPLFGDADFVTQLRIRSNFAEVLSGDMLVCKCSVSDNQMNIGKICLVSTDTDIVLGRISKIYSDAGKKSAGSPKIVTIELSPESQPSSTVLSLPSDSIMVNTILSAIHLL